MTMKAYTMQELSGRGFDRFEEIPEEMLDYLPENIEQDENTLEEPTDYFFL